MAQRLSVLAALGLVCLMVGATLTNLFVLGTSPLLPVGLLVVSAGSLGPLAADQEPSQWARALSRAGGFETTRRSRSTVAPCA